MRAEHSCGSRCPGVPGNAVTVLSLYYVTCARTAERFGRRAPSTPAGGAAFEVRSEITSTSPFWGARALARFYSRF